MWSHYKSKTNNETIVSNGEARVNWCREKENYVDETKLNFNQDKRESIKEVIVV